MNERLRQVPYQIQVPEQDVEVPGGTLGAALRLENDVVNAFASLRRGPHGVDENFNIAEAAEQSPLWEDHSGLLSRATSAAEFSSMSQRIQQEALDRQRLAQAGWQGFAAAFGAGVMSPVMAIPLVGPARGARGVAQAFALAGAAATAQELPLLQNQLLRTGTESGIAIAAGTVLGGLLGTSALWLRSRHRDRLAQDLSWDAPNTPRATLVRQPDGTYARVGDDIPLRLPPGTVRSPAALVRVMEIEEAHQAVATAARQGDYSALRALIDNPKTPFEVRGMAQDILESTTAGARATQAARAIQAPEPVAVAWGRVVETRAAGTESVAAQQARRELDEALDALNVPREQRPQLLDRLEREAQPAAPPAASNAARLARDRLVEPYYVRAGEEDLPMSGGGSTGAKLRDEEFTPRIQWTNPETGKVEWVDLIDPDAPVDPNSLVNPGAVGRAAAITNPVIMTVEQPFMPIKARSAGQAMLTISDGGVNWQNSRHGIAPRAGGTLEHRIGHYYGRLADSLLHQQEAYIAYLGDKASFWLKAGLRLQLLQGWRASGKVSFIEFKEQVVDSFHNGFQSPIKEANDTARYISRNFFGAFNEAMLEATEGRGAKALYEILDTADPRKHYFTHVFSVESIARDRNGFIDMVADYYQSVASATASRRWQKMMQREAEDAELESILRMNADEVRVEMDAVNDALAQMPRASDLDPRLDRIKDLRDRSRQLRDEEMERLLDGDGFTRGDPDSERAAKRMAQQNVREEYDALREEINLLESQLEPTARASFDQERALRRRRAALQRAFGRYEQRQQELQTRMEQNDEANLRALERFETQVRQTEARLDRIDDEALDTELVRLETQFDKIMKQIDNGETRIERLRQKYTPDEPTERISIEEARQAMRRQRAENSLERFGRAAAFDREGARQAIRDRLTSAREYVNKVNSNRAARNERMRQQVEALDPEQVSGRVERMKSSRERREDEFREWLRQAGSTDFDLTKGTFDFSETAQELAAGISYKITGHTSRIGQMDILPDLRGPMKRRVLDIPYEQKKKYLDMDSERVLGRYTRTMAADIEIFRAFGSVSGKNMLQNVETELRAIERTLRDRTVDESGKTITDARRARDVKRHAIGAKMIMGNLEHQLDRVRGLAGIPDDPYSVGYRLGKAALNFNMPIMMGSAMITSIPDIARPMAAHGLMRTFRDAWMPLVRGLMIDAQKPVNAAIGGQLKFFNITVEVFTQQRARGGFDFMSEHPGVTAPERGLEWMAHKTPQIAFFGPWTDWNKNIAGRVSLTRMLTAVDDLVSGRLRPGHPDIDYLASAGITPQFAARIAEQFNSPNGHVVINGTKIPQAENWTDYGAMRAFSAAMQRDVDRTIITPGLERPRFSDRHILSRLFMQFRSFTMSANSKILIAGLQSRDMAAVHQLQGMVFSLALGALSYYAWAMSTSDRAREEMLNASWETWLDQAIYRSGILGAFAEVQSVAGRIPATAPYATFAGGGNLAGRRPSSIVNAIAGPTAGTVETMANVLAGMDQPTQGTLSQARKLIPYQNVFYLRRLLNMVEEGAADALGLPESRR